MNKAFWLAVAATCCNVSVGLFLGTHHVRRANMPPRTVRAEVIIPFGLASMLIQGCSLRVGLSPPLQHAARGVEEERTPLCRPIRAAGVSFTTLPVAASTA